MAANSPSSPSCTDCAAKRIVLHAIARQPLSYNKDTGAGLYAGILAHVSVSNPPVGSTILRPKKHFKNEQRSKDAAAKKRPNTSGVYREN